MNSDVLTRINADKISVYHLLIGVYLCCKKIERSPTSGDFQRVKVKRIKDKSVKNQRVTSHKKRDNAKVIVNFLVPTRWRGNFFIFRELRYHAGAWERAM